MNRKILLLSLFLLPVVGGCQAINALKVQVVNHPAPQREPPDMAVFKQAGCAIDEDGWWACPADSPIAALGCDRIKPVDALLGALDPVVSMAECLYYPTQHLEEHPDAFDTPRLYNEGCLLPVYVRYVILNEGEFTILSTLDDLQTVFAPLESPDEALAYGLAATGLQAKYGLKRQPSFRYLTERLEDSHVKEAHGGYEVLLYHYQICGCGPHTTSAVWLEISRDGDLREISRTPAFENPQEDNLCVD